MASSDARAVPIKGVAFRLYFDMSKADGTPITTWTFASTGGKVSKDGAAFADTTNAIVEVGAGVGYIDLTATEMNAYSIVFYANLTNTGAVLTKCYLYPALGTGLDIPVKSVAISDGIIAAATFAANALDAVWSTASRTLSTFGFSVTVGTNSDKTGYSLSSAGVQAIWDALTSALTTVGSIGKRFVDNLDAAVSTRLASGSYTAPDNTSIGAIKAQTDQLAFTGAKVDAQVQAMSANSLDAAALKTDAVTEIALGLLDTLLSGHTSIGSVGAALQAGGSAGDPWTTALDTYTGDQAGAVLRAVRVLLATNKARVVVPYDASRALITMKREYGLVEVGGATVPVIPSRRITTLTGATIKLIVRASYGSTEQFEKDLTSESLFDGDDLLTSIVITPSEAAEFASRTYFWELVAVYTGGTVLLDEGQIDIR